MYNVKWDKQHNGVVLVEDDTGMKPPRPVFHEELDLLGFNEFFQYDQSEFPLAWAIDRRYFYKGTHIATVKGGNSFEKPSIDVKNIIDEKLCSTDMEALVHNNKRILEELRDTAVLLAKGILYTYKDIPWAVSYSGGKDSQVLLDIMSHVGSSDVVFMDVGLEHEFVYDAVVSSVNDYDDFTFIRTRSKRDVLDLVNDMGLPSRFHRWCTPVLKTTPFNNLMNKLYGKEEKVIVFEGVRREESKKREDYNVIAENVYNPRVINVRPLLMWNMTEIYLYILIFGLKLNKLYRHGCRRVSCQICPFSPKWESMIYGQIKGEKYTSLNNKILDYAVMIGADCPSDYIREEYWKSRGGGKGMSDKPVVEFNKSLERFVGLAVYPSDVSSFEEWFKIFKDDVEYDLEYVVGGWKVTFYDITTKQRTLLKKIVRKACFCVLCGVCESNCPTGALTMDESVCVDENVCVGCGSCIVPNYHGCYRSKSLYDRVGQYGL